MKLTTCAFLIMNVIFAYLKRNDYDTQINHNAINIINFKREDLCVNFCCAEVSYSLMRVMGKFSVTR